MAEALIRQRVEDAVKALNAKDIDGVMSLYAPNIVSFDIGLGSATGARLLSFWPSCPVQRTRSATRTTPGVYGTFLVISSPPS
jgi:ketosteroid isomerase-like protein